MILVIRAGQIEAFKAARRRLFAAQLETEMRERFPAASAALPAPELGRRIADAVERAWSYGLREDRQLRWFVRLTFAVGLRFDAHPPIHAVLIAAGVDAADKVERLMFGFHPREWTAAARLGDGEAPGHAREM